MTKFNKYVFDSCFVSHIKLDSKNFVLIPLYLCRSMEPDHVKPNLVHEFFRIQSIGIIPLEQF